MTSPTPSNDLLAFALMVLIIIVVSALTARSVVHRMLAEEDDMYAPDLTPPAPIAQTSFERDQAVGLAPFIPQPSGWSAGRPCPPSLRPVLAEWSLPPGARFTPAPRQEDLHPDPERLQALALQLIDPDVYAPQCSPDVRNAARLALGLVFRSYP